MSEDINVQIYINKKEIMYSHQNIVSVINTFLPYLTNPDLDELNDRCKSLLEHRHQQEQQQSQLEENRTPILSNRHDT
jgi:hypothetical protein